MSYHPYNVPGSSRHSQSRQSITRRASAPGPGAPSALTTSLPSIRELHPAIPWTGSLPSVPSGSQSTAPSPVLSLLPPPPQSPPLPLSDDHSADSQAPSAFERKRNRASYSCTECKRRKIRCDRNIPCQPCKKRRESYNCRMSDAATPSEASVSRKEFNDLENRYIDLDYRYSELEKVLHLLLEAVAEGRFPTPAESNAMRTRITSLSHTGITSQE
ncbi:hypothetical protein DL96DRAFT_1576593 [Flagelloscypha sp. PMI_526]|nr:hypothetical protein DL96DRAFT_1576593 [Flagelloscypha sp. PMI_526]